MKTPRNLHEYFLTSDVEKLNELKGVLRALKNNPNLEKSAEFRTFLEEFMDARISEVQAEAVQKKNPFERK
jgi:hypothetical protein